MLPRYAIHRSGLVCAGIRRALLSLLAAYSIGCGASSGMEDGVLQTASSNGIATEELEAYISVVSSSPRRVVVGASFEHDSILFGVEDVELGSGDSVRATMAGHNRTLQRDPTVSAPYYETIFETTPAEGSVKLRFRGSTFTIPLRPEFTVTSPTPGLALGFQDHLELVWTPGEPGGVMRIWIRRSCKSLTGGTRGGSFYAQVFDRGAYSYDLGLLPEATDPAVDISQDCTLDVELVRSAATNIAPPFSSFSHLESTQTRAVRGMTISF